MKECLISPIVGISGIGEELGYNLVPWEAEVDPLSPSQDNDEICYLLFHTPMWIPGFIGIPEEVLVEILVHQILVVLFKASL